MHKLKLAIRRTLRGIRLRGSLAGAVLVLAALGGVAGCGETSFIEVTVSAPRGANEVDVSTITSCEVVVSGADTDSFPLRNCGPGQVFGSTVGVFQYGTGSSGELTFEVVLLNNLVPIGRGSNSAMIKSGGRQTVTVNVTRVAQ
jgi:hypothetical protein